MGLPFLQIEFTGVDASVPPTERSARVVQDALDGEFPPNPHAVAAETDDAAAVQAWARTLPGTVSPPQQADGLWRIDVVTADDFVRGGEAARPRHPCQ